MPPKKSQMGQKYKSSSKDVNLRAKKAASDAAVASTGVNPAPMGRPWPTKEAGVQLLSPPTAPLRGSEKRCAEQAAGEDSGLKRVRRAQGAYAEEDAAECSPLQYVTVNEAEVRTAIKVAYVQTLGAPPKSEWKGSDGTINIIRKQLVKGVGYGTVEDQLCRIMAAEENKMDVDVGVRCYAGTGVHNRRQEVGC